MFRVTVVVDFNGRSVHLPVFFVMAVDDVAAIDAARLIIGGQLIDGVPKPQWEPEYHISVELT